MTTLIKRLNEDGATLALEAAAALESNAKVIAALREALEPFARLARDYAASDEIRARQHRDERGSTYVYPATNDYHHASVTLGDCRNARLALEHTATFEQTAAKD
jgi:hypothetical protein